MDDFIKNELGKMGKNPADANNNMGGGYQVDGGNLGGGGFDAGADGGFDVGASGNLGMGGAPSSKKPAQPFKPFDVKKKLGTGVGFKPMVGPSGGMNTQNAYGDIANSSTNLD